jgi:chemotaxis protein MotC
VTALALACATHGEAAELLEQVRALNRLQGEMARGSGSARRAIAAQIVEVEKTLGTLDAEAWKEPQNARAAAIFLLCGGSARAVRRIVDEHLVADGDLPLVSGSVAFAEGHSQEAAKLLSTIDARTQPVTLGGHLALIQGGFLIGSDHPRARKLFDLARLLMPSSLVEEAALRRELSIMDAMRETDRFLMLARRYVAEYSRSPFSRNFWDEIRATTLRVSTRVDERSLDEFLSLFKDTSPTTRFDVHMAVARRAILGAKIALAIQQTKLAEPFAVAPAAQARLRLYRGAVDALGGDFETATRSLRGLDASAFSPSDLELRDIVISAVDRLEESETMPAAPNGAAEPSWPESPIEASARQAIADVDALLQRATKP